MSRRSTLVLLAVAGVSAFGVLYVLVSGTHPELNGIDARILNLATASELRGSRGVLSAFSSATDTQPLVIASALVGLGAWLSGAGRAAISFWAVSIFSSLTVTVLKQAIDRSRPPLGVAVESSAAFPSGHASGSLVFALCVALLVWHSSGDRCRILIWGLVPAAVVVGYSRVFLGLHWGTDVLAGWIVAATAGALFVALSGARSGVEPVPGALKAPAPLWLYGSVVAALIYLGVVGVTAPLIT